MCPQNALSAEYSIIIPPFSYNFFINFLIISRRRRLQKLNINFKL